MQSMRKTVHPTADRTTPGGFDAKANHELLFKGVFLVVIGLAVLISPGFVASPDMQSTLAGAAWVGWFALVLGAAFVSKGMVRHWKARQAGS